MNFMRLFDHVFAEIDAHEIPLTSEHHSACIELAYGCILLLSYCFILFHIAFHVPRFIDVVV